MAICSIPLIFDSCPPLHNRTVRDILLVHMYFYPSVTINARFNETYLQYVQHNLLAHISFSSLVLCISLGTLHYLLHWQLAATRKMLPWRAFLPVSGMMCILLWFGRDCSSYLANSIVVKLFHRFERCPSMLDSVVGQAFVLLALFY